MTFFFLDIVFLLYYLFNWTRLTLSFPLQLVNLPSNFYFGYMLILFICSCLSQYEFDIYGFRSFVDLLNIPSRSGVSSSTDCEEQISELESLLDSQVIFWQILSPCCSLWMVLLIVASVMVSNAWIYGFVLYRYMQQRRGWGWTNLFLLQRRLVNSMIQ